MWPFEKRKVEIDYDVLNNLYKRIALYERILTGTNSLVLKYQEIVERIRTRYPYVWNENISEEDSKDLAKILRETMQ